MQTFSPCAVEIRRVTKIFKKEAAEVVALNETDLTIGAGEFLCLMGPSGSGKSTLLNLIAGIDRPSSGQIIVGGEDIAQMSESHLAVWRNQTIGFIFQTFNLIPVLTAFENIELPLMRLLFDISIKVCCFRKELRREPTS